MPAQNHNRPLGRSAEFEHLLAEIFRQAGWRVDRQPKLANGQPDLVAQHRGKKYVFELKVSSDGRKDRAVPPDFPGDSRSAVGRAAGSGAAIPVAIIAADHIFELGVRRGKTVCATKCTGRGNRNHRCRRVPELCWPRIGVTERRAV